MEDQILQSLGWLSVVPYLLTGLGGGVAVKLYDSYLKGKKVNQEVTESKESIEFKLREQFFQHFNKELDYLRSRISFMENERKATLDSYLKVIEDLKNANEKITEQSNKIEEQEAEILKLRQEVDTLRSRLPKRRT